MITIKSYASGSDGNFYIVQNENTNIILECGGNRSNVISNIWKENLKMSDINACITSHSHGDHSSNIKHFADYDIKIYCTKETQDKYLANIHPALKRNIHILEDNKIIRINTIQVLPLKVNHGDTECYGFIIHDKDEDVLFITDFFLMTQNLHKFKFTKIYIETNYTQQAMTYVLTADQKDEKIIKYKRQIKVHCSLENAIRYLESFDLSNCHKIICIHLSKELANGETIKKTIEKRFAIPTYYLNYKGDEL